MYPILFSIGAFTIYSFGTLIAIGYLLAGMFLWRDTRRKGEDPALLFDLGMGMMLSGLLGGRALYIFLNLKEYLAQPLEIVKIHHGGLVFYGGFVGAFGFAIFFAKRKGRSVWGLLDEIIPYAVLIHAFGRIGCFLNGCCFGLPTSFFLGVVFPGGVLPLHPTQLYESFFLLLLFVLLRALSQRKMLATPGSLFLVYLFYYSLLRFGVEFFRGDQERFLWGWTRPQLSSILLLGMSCLFWKGRRRA